MKNLLIIYPHWPPSNLAGVHRPRLIANYLSKYGWHPIVLTVQPEYYEEPHDWDLCKTVSDRVEIHHAKAFKITKPRIIGDIGLRAFRQIYIAAKKIIKQKKIDFIWIPIPSFYTAIIGRLLFERTKTPYGIDYIDPWVRNITGRRDWRHVLSNALAKALEPIALKKAVLVTGVAEEYYMPALKRNFKRENIIRAGAKPETITQDSAGNQQFNLPRRLSAEKAGQAGNSTNQQIFHLAFPYGFDPNDHKIKLKDLKYPWRNIKNCKPLVYAGAFLPNSRLFVENLFKAMRQLINENKWDEKSHLYFLGTGSYSGKTILDYAQDHKVDAYIHEDRRRYPFVHILNFLSACYGVMVIGSTEKHYTASKVFQSVLSKRPVFAILHKESSASQVLAEARADTYSVEWDERFDEKDFQNRMKESLSSLVNDAKGWKPDCQILETKYSSKVSAKKLTDCLDRMVELNSAQRPIAT